MIQTIEEVKIQKIINKLNFCKQMTKELEYQKKTWLTSKTFIHFIDKMIEYIEELDNEV